MKKLFLSFFALATLAVSAQKATGKLSFQKGQTIEVTTNVNITMQSMMGEMPMKMVLTEQYLVGDVGADQIQLTKLPKRVQMNASAMGQDIKIDSDNPKDLEGQFGGPVKEIMKKKHEFTVDATGKVLSVKEDAAKKGDAAGGMNMMMPGMDMMSAAPVVGQASLFKILPARDVAKGDTWTDSTSTEGNSSHTVYTVKDITDTEVVLDFTGDTKTKAKQSAMGTEVDVNSTGKNSGTVTLDRATGLLKQKTTAGEMESNISVAGQEMNTSSKSTVAITAKTL